MGVTGAGAVTAAPLGATAPWNPARVRDLSVMSLPDGSQLVIACDSIGGIGPKPGDSVTATAYTTGHFAVRVPLLELVAAGASPRLIVNNLCFERGPDADETIRAIVDLAAEVGLDAAAVTGSTEDNARTTVTGIGVTVIGSAGRNGLRTGRSRPGDLVLCLGRPRSAPVHELRATDREMPTIGEVVAALSISGVHEALPVGSGGIAAEIAELAGTAGLRYQLAGRHQLQDLGLDVTASGGPSSCVLVSLTTAALDGVRAIRVDLPVLLVGELF